MLYILTVVLSLGGVLRLHRGDGKGSVKILYNRQVRA
jgi:hypothetical protein